MIHTTFEAGSAGSFDFFVSQLLVLSPGLCVELVHLLPIGLELSPVCGNSSSEIIHFEFPLDDLELIEGIWHGGGLKGEDLLVLELSYLLLLLGMASIGVELGDILGFFIRISLVTFTKMRISILVCLGRVVVLFNYFTLFSVSDLFLDGSFELLTLLAEDVLEMTLEAGAEL